MGRKEFAQRLSEHDPEVRRTLRQFARELPPNPREIKRFINVFRFYAYIQYWREDAGLPTPTLNGVAKLALLESAQDEADWAKQAQLAPEHVRAEVERTVALRELVMRKPVVGPFASGFV